MNTTSLPRESNVLRSSNNRIILKILVQEYHANSNSTRSSTESLRVRYENKRKRTQCDLNNLNS